MSSAGPDRDVFQTIPWCDKILNDPSLVLVPTTSRRYKEATTEDAFFGRTLNTAETIDACVSLYRRPTPPGSSRIDEVLTLLSLGSGLNGWPKVCHGGAVATIVDEVMGVLLSVNRHHGDAQFRGTTMTAYLNVKYLKAVATPQVVLVKAKFQQVKGRKRFVESTVMNGEGDVLAEGSALFVDVREQKEKL